MNHENTIVREGAGNHTEGLSRVSPPHATTGAVSGDGCSSARAVHLLTSSRLRLYQSCPRAHHYRYEVGLTPTAPETGARALGTAVHAGLEAWWLAYKEGAPQYALPSAIRSAEDAFPFDEPFTLAMIRALVTGYDAAWCDWAAGVEVLGVELPFEAPLTHPVTGAPSATWRIAGKLDALVRLSDGRVAIIEHKTRAGDAAVGSDYRRKLTLDPQVSTYFEGVRALGYEADVCVYDVLCKPSIKPLLATPEEDRIYTQEKSRACKECRKVEKNRAPLPHIEGGIACVEGRIITDAGGRLRANQREHDETAVEYEKRLIDTIAADRDRYLVHAEIVRSDAEREAHQWALWHVVRSIEETRRAARVARDVRAVPQSPASCFGTGHRCDFLDICEGTASARDTTRFKRLPTVHPELATEVSDARR